MCEQIDKVASSLRLRPLGELAAPHGRHPFAALHIDQAFHQLGVHPITWRRPRQISPTAPSVLSLIQAEGFRALDLLRQLKLATGAGHEPSELLNREELYPYSSLYCY